MQNKSTEALVSISVVSHGQSMLVEQLLNDIVKLRISHVEIILTLNIEETLSFSPEELGVPIKIIRNTSPQGYGANNNSAFKVAKGGFFCVMNPDIRLTSNPFPKLLQSIGNPSVGVVGPLVYNSAGTIEDSARHFPTPLGILARKLERNKTTDYMMIGNKSLNPDWIAGMFMLFRREIYETIGGFDERYFMYLEDADLCARIWSSGKKVVLNPNVSIIHDAQRHSSKSFKYFKWHLMSMMRFFIYRMFLSHKR